MKMYSMTIASALFITSSLHAMEKHATQSTPTTPTTSNNDSSQSEANCFQRAAQQCVNCVDVLVFRCLFCSGPNSTSNDDNAK